MSADAFASACLRADLQAICQHLQTFFANLAPSDWEEETEPGGWTLRQTLAHLDAVAHGYWQFMASSVRDTPPNLPNFGQRTDLPAWNERMIAERMRLSVTAVKESFFTTLQTCVDLATSLSEADLAETVDIPAYGRPLTVAELLGAQAAHPGLVHAAQLPNAVKQPALWHNYAVDLWQRQLTRTFCLMACSYWPERGGKLDTAVNFVVRGQAGTSWHVTMTPQGSDFGTGRAPKASLTLWFRSLDSLSRSLTAQLSPVHGLLAGQIFAWGNPFLALRLSHLFNPT